MPGISSLVRNIIGEVQSVFLVSFEPDTWGSLVFDVCWSACFELRVLELSCLVIIGELVSEPFFLLDFSGVSGMTVSTSFPWTEDTTANKFNLFGNG